MKYLSSEHKSIALHYVESVIKYQRDLMPNISVLGQQGNMCLLDAMPNHEVTLWNKLAAVMYDSYDIRIIRCITFTCSIQETIQGSQIITILSTSVLYIILDSLQLWNSDSLMCSECEIIVNHPIYSQCLENHERCEHSKEQQPCK